jgi:transcriptional regulator with XRE-family HTH domain
MSTWIQNKRKLSGLSQTEVAQSLGISRPTYMKLEQGEVKLTEQQKALLSRIFEVSQGMLEKNVAEMKPISGHVEIREIPQENVVKFREVLLYILGKVGSRPNIGQTALYKLLYFIDFDYYERFEQQLVGATYMKNTYGPTPVSFAKIVKQMKREGSLVEVKSKYFDLDQTKYMPAKEADVSSLSGQELNHIDNELERLAHLSARQLSELSHKDTPWLVAKDKEVLDYEYVFYRPEETSVREYEPL